MLAEPGNRQLEDAYNMTIGETLAAYNDNKYKSTENKHDIDQLNFIY